MHVLEIHTQGWDLVVKFANGITRKVDIRKFLKDASSPEAVKIRTDMRYFQLVELEDGASLDWPGRFSIDPDCFLED